MLMEFGETEQAKEVLKQIKQLKQEVVAMSTSHADYKGETGDVESSADVVDCEVESSEDRDVLDFCEQEQD
jgi:phage host-nuclease inhibitor protein Gam